MAEEKSLRQKQLEELECVVRVVVDMVDPPGEGAINNGTLLEHLHEALQKISSYLSEATKTYVAHVLGLTKSFWPKCSLSPLTDGIATDCSNEKFVEYLEEVGHVAQKIVENLEQD
jgi:hypothetical protein